MMTGALGKYESVSLTIVYNSESHLLRKRSTDKRLRAFCGLLAKRFEGV